MEQKIKNMLLKLRNIDEAEINTNFSDELKKLFSYIDWYDECANSENELIIKSTENLLKFRDW